MRVKANRYFDSQDIDVDGYNNNHSQTISIAPEAFLNIKIKNSNHIYTSIFFSDINYFNGLNVDTTIKGLRGQATENKLMYQLTRFNQNQIDSLCSVAIQLIRFDTVTVRINY